MDSDWSVLLVHRKRLLIHVLKFSEQSEYSREAFCPSGVLQKSVLVGDGDDDDDGDDDEAVQESEASECIELTSQISIWRICFVISKSNRYSRSCPV